METKIQPNPIPESVIPPQPPTVSVPQVIWFTAGLLFLFSVITGAYFLGKYGLPVWVSGKKICTFEAKVCPDGSTVGRTGPTCEFSPCPTASPTPGPTANWKTYVNPQLNFSFKYPQDWVVNKEQIFGSRTEIDFEYNQTTTLALLIIANYNNATGKPFGSLDEYIEPRTSKSSDITVGDLKAKFITDPGDGGHIVPYKEAVIFLPNNSYILSFYYQTDYYGKPQSDKVLNQILSTFTFLDQAGGEEVEGIQITTCCSCPTKMLLSQIGKDGWILYEKGKNYSSLLPKYCERADCAPCPPLETKSFTCPENGWVDCMPILTPEAQVACSTEAMEWYKANCPNFKGGAL